MENNGTPQRKSRRRSGGFLPRADDVIWGDGRGYWHKFGPPPVLVRFLLLAIALSAVVILAAEMGPHGSGHSRAVMDARNRRAVQARTINTPAEHILFLVASSQAVEDAMVAAIKTAAPSSVTDPLRLLSSSSTTESAESAKASNDTTLPTTTTTAAAAVRNYVTTIESAWRLHARSPRGRDLPEEAWTTVLVLLPRPSASGGRASDRLWSAELPALVHRLIRRRPGTRVALAVVREYLPDGVARDVGPKLCATGGGGGGGRNSHLPPRKQLRTLHSAVEVALRLGNAVERLQEWLVEDELEPMLYAMDHDRSAHRHRSDAEISGVAAPLPSVVVSDVRAESFLTYAPVAVVGDDAAAGPHQRLLLLLRWMQYELGVWSGALPLNSGATLARAFVPSFPHRKHLVRRRRDAVPHCPLALSSTLRYIASLPPDRVRTLPRLSHLALWRPDDDANGSVKIVAVTQVRNVQHTLLGFLKSIDWLADAIVLLDTGSVDATVRLAEAWAAAGAGSVVRCPLTIIKADADHDDGGKKSTKEWHEGLAYRRLLNEARAMGATHILTPDSDEYPTYNWRRQGLLRNFLLSLPVAMGLEVRLFHVYDGIDRWLATRPSGWGQVEKAPLGWHDDGVSQRAIRVHHMSRMPAKYGKISLTMSRSMGSMHFKFASLQGSVAKTVWYKHLEWLQGHRSRATSSFYDKKLPKVSAGAVLHPVPSDDWYGPPRAEGALGGSMRRWAFQWTERESWAWRVRMVERWRREARDSFPFRLPADWPLGVKVLAMPSGTAAAAAALPQPVAVGGMGHGGGAIGGLDPLDKECRRRYVGDGGKTTAAAAARSPSTGMSIADTGVELATVREGGRKFLWANPDRHVYRWLKTSEPHVRDFFHRALPAHNIGITHASMAVSELVSQWYGSLVEAISRENMCGNAWTKLSRV